MTSLSSFVVVVLFFNIYHNSRNLIKQAARLSAFQRRVDALAVSVVFSAGLEQVISAAVVSKFFWNSFFPDKDKNSKTNLKRKRSI